MAWGGWGGFGGYASLSVPEMQARAAKQVAALEKRGRTLAPVVIEGRKIAATFWGKAWCATLESYSDYATRLPRGRTYARNGMVIDLVIEAGKIQALVSGTDVYEVRVDILPLAPAAWKEMIAACAGRIDSVIALLEGRLPEEILGVIARTENGLFPTPRQIMFRCSCPDAASMCKHIAATLYGVGARFDERPDLFFVLRGVDKDELITKGSIGPRVAAVDASRRIDPARLTEIFGIELEPAPATPAKKKTQVAKKPAAKKPKR